MKIVITFCEDTCALLRDTKDFKEVVEKEPLFRQLVNYEKDFLNKFIEDMDYQRHNFLDEYSRFELIGQSNFSYDEASITLSLLENKIKFYPDSGFEFDDNRNLGTFQITAKLEGDEEEFSDLNTGEIYDTLMVSMKSYVDDITEKIQEYIDNFGF